MRNARRSSSDRLSNSAAAFLMLTFLMAHQLQLPSSSSSSSSYSSSSCLHWRPTSATSAMGRNTQPSNSSFSKLFIPPCSFCVSIRVQGWFLAGMWQVYTGYSDQYNPGIKLVFNIYGTIIIDVWNKIISNISLAENFWLRILVSWCSRTRIRDS
jgi:hypothetical protein